jgi:hypothetical protein
LRVLFKYRILLVNHEESTTIRFTFKICSKFCSNKLTWLITKSVICDVQDEKRVEQSRLRIWIVFVANLNSISIRSEWSVIDWKIRIETLLHWRHLNTRLSSQLAIFQLTKGVALINIWKTTSYCMCEPNINHLNYNFCILGCTWNF